MVKCVTGFLKAAFWCHFYSCFCCLPPTLFTPPHVFRANVTVATTVQRLQKTLDKKKTQLRGFPLFSSPPNLNWSSSVLQSKVHNFLLWRCFWEAEEQERKIAGQSVSLEMLIGVSFFLAINSHRVPSRYGRGISSLLQQRPPTTSDQQPTFQMPTIGKVTFTPPPLWVLAPISFTPIVEFIYQFFRFPRPPARHPLDGKGGDKNYRSFG